MPLRSTASSASYSCTSRNEASSIHTQGLNHCRASTRDRSRMSHEWPRRTCASSCSITGPWTSSLMTMLRIHEKGLTGPAWQYMVAPSCRSVHRHPLGMKRARRTSPTAFHTRTASIPIIYRRTKPLHPPLGDGVDGMAASSETPTTSAGSVTLRRASCCDSSELRAVLSQMCRSRHGTVSDTTTMPSNMARFMRNRVSLRISSA